MIVVLADNESVLLSRRGSRGADARTVERLLSELGRFRPTITLGEPLHVNLLALDAAIADAITRDRNGDEADPVQDDAVTHARSFLQILPPTLPRPEVRVDLEGEICLEWDQGRRRVFSVSIGRDGRLAFAGLYGSAWLHGEEQFMGSIPSVILEALHRVMEESSG